MTRAMKALSVIFYNAIIVAALAGCTDTRSATLDGTQWKLAGWSISSQHAADTGITTAFSNGKVTGYSGINSYGGTYAATPAGTFSVGSLTITEMAGPEPQMRAERSYVMLLERAASYKTHDGRLTLYDTGGNESLIFEPTLR